MHWSTDVPSLVGAGAGACAAATAGMTMARTSTAATARPDGALAMADSGERRLRRTNNVQAISVAKGCLAISLLLLLVRVCNSLVPCLLPL
uniref:Uncharacterized protein n=1 Tax=Arundo donax TaxID=35708 RepID=A0A0A9EWP6_ARUDO